MQARQPLLLKHLAYMNSDCVTVVDAEKYVTHDNYQTNKVYRAVFNSTLQHLSQWLWLPLEMRFPNFLRPATLNQRGHSIITFSQNVQIWTPFPLFALIRFW